VGSIGEFSVLLGGRQKEMRKLTMVVFVIALVIVAYETFQAQPPFTANTSLTGAIQALIG
jgi:hypothetical protein